MPVLPSLLAANKAWPDASDETPAPRHAEAYAYATGLFPPVRLALHPLPTGFSYAVVSFWEERVPGQVKRTTLQKSIRVAALRQPSGRLQLNYEAAPPVFQKPDVTSFERVLLLLTELYQHLELQVAPTGQVLRVLNEAAIQQTWVRVKQELVRRSGGEDDFTQILLTGLGEQLQRPGALLASLRLDYFFGFLLPNVYGQRFESGFRYGQARCFPQFFADQDLWFWERLELAAPSGPERAVLRLRGQPDPTRTNLAEVARQLDAARQLLSADATAPPTPPEKLRLTYEATAELDTATGWPVCVEASVRCEVADGYGKEYFIRLEQQALTP